MEIFWIIAFFTGLGFLGWVYEQIQEYLENERSKKRDEIAVNVISEYELTSDDKDSVDKIFDNMMKNILGKVEKIEEYEIVAPIRATSIKDNLCPNCGMGFLVRRKGQYGTFLGCNRYPNCKTTKPVGWVNKDARNEARKAKEVQKEQFSKRFIEDLREAYN